MDLTRREEVLMKAKVYVPNIHQLPQNWGDSDKSLFSGKKLEDLLKKQLQFLLAGLAINFRNDMLKDHLIYLAYTKMEFEKKEREEKEAAERRRAAFEQQMVDYVENFDLAMFESSSGAGGETNHEEPSTSTKKY